MPSNRRPTSPQALLFAFYPVYALAISASAYKPRPYEVNVDPSLIESTRLKASSFRHSIDIDEPLWTDGPPSTEIVSIAEYWSEKYDWFDTQAQINARFSHFMTTIPPPGGNYNRSLDVHFIHEQSSRKDATPMLMLHGWPSTSLEWAKVMPTLANPEDDTHPAFHIVAPDLPGYGFSPAPATAGLGPLEHAEAFASLMQQLGYDRYAVYSTDLGFVVALALLAEHQSRILQHVTDFYLVFPNATDINRFATNQTTDEEAKFISAANAFFKGHEAYANLHSTLPLSVAYALNDSPIGFLAWMYQLVHTVSDKVFNASELITDALLLYLPGVYGNIRSYKELYPGLAQLTDGTLQTTDVPTAVLQFGGISAYPEIAYLNYVPRAWVERTANITYFGRFASGGHFPALSEPKLLVDEIRKIFNTGG